MPPPTHPPPAAPRLLNGRSGGDDETIGETPIFHTGRAAARRVAPELGMAVYGISDASNANNALFLGRLRRGEVRRSGGWRIAVCVFQLS